MSSTIDSLAWGTVDHGQSQLLPSQRWLDVASVGTRAELEDLDELVELASAEANCLLSISEVAGGSSLRKRTLRNRRLQSQSSAPPAVRRLYEDKQALLGTLERNPFALEFASEELQADYDVVTRAVSVHGLTLQYVAPCWQSDREIVLLAIHTSGGSGMKFASPDLREDRQFALAAVSSSGYALQHVSPELADDEDVVNAAVAQMGSACQFASARLRDALFEKGHTLREMQWRCKYTASDARAFGYSLQDLLRAEYTLSVADVLIAGYSFSDMRAAGYTLRQFREENFAPVDAKALGYTLIEMVKAGYDLCSLHAAGYSDSEIFKAGFSLHTLRQGGFTAVDARSAGLDSNGCRALRLAGYTVQQTTDAGFTVADCVKGGFTWQAVNRSRVLLQADISIAGLPGVLSSGSTHMRLQHVRRRELERWREHEAQCRGQVPLRLDDAIAAEGS